MSSEIIYHQTMARLPATPNGNPEDLYFHLVQIGSSNCFEIDHKRPNGNGRRSRSWKLISLGTRQQVMNTAIMLGGDCEGGMLKIGSASKGASPEQLIRKVRKLLQEADKTDIRLGGIAYKGYPIAVMLKSEDTASKERRYFDYGKPQEVKDFLAVYAQRLDSKVNVAWDMANVRGPELR